MRKAALGLIAMAGAVALGGCAQSPVSQGKQRHAKEYFPESLYGRASARVVADGEPVPKGGGQYLVGHAYTVAGHTYVPSEKKFAAVGLASWYGDAFHGRRTANGEVYDKNGVTAAHPTMPLPSYARVTNLRNHRSIIVRVNDRGPYHGGRVMDLSATAAEALAYKSVGTAKVKVEYVGHASIAGSDDRKLLATLRVDGAPAQLNDFAFSPTRIAERQDDLPRRPAEPDRQSERLALQQPESAQAEQEAPLAQNAAPLAQQAAPLAQQPAPLPPQRSIRSAYRAVESDIETRAEAAVEPPTPPQRVALADATPSALPHNPPLPPQRPYDLGATRSISVARR
jgi:rare lipoprotein A